MKNVVIIPARYDSVRFPGKVLAKETGKYLVEHTYERASQACNVQAVYIATDSERVQAAQGIWRQHIMTSDCHKSGTDRIAEAAVDIDADIIINVQEMSEISQGYRYVGFYA